MTDGTIQAALNGFSGKPGQRFTCEHCRGLVLLRNAATQEQKRSRGFGSYQSICADCCKQQSFAWVEDITG